MRSSIKVLTFFAILAPALTPAMAESPDSDNFAGTAAVTLSAGLRLQNHWHLSTSALLTRQLVCMP